TVRQAGEFIPPVPRQAARLRTGPRPGGGQRRDGAGGGRRDAGLHVTRAGQRPRPRRPDRPVQPGERPVPGGDGAGRLLGPDADRHTARRRGEDPAAGPRGEPSGPGGAVVSDRVVTPEETSGPSGVGRRGGDGTVPDSSQPGGADGGLAARPSCGLAPAQLVPSLPPRRGEHVRPVPAPCSNPVSLPDESPPWKWGWFRPVPGAEHPL